MKIYKVHTLANGQTLALIDVREAPLDLKRSGFLLCADKATAAEQYTSWDPGAIRMRSPASHVMSTYEQGLCQVFLEDLTKRKVHKVIGEWSIIDIDKVPEGVERTVPLNDAILRRGVVPPSYCTGERGPKAKYDILVYTAVRTEQLITAAQGKHDVVVNNDPRKPDYGKVRALDTFDGKTREQCFDIYSQWMRGETRDQKLGGFRVPIGELLTAAQLVAAKAEWSARLKAKVTASEAEAKAKDRNQVLVDVDPEDYL